MSLEYFLLLFFLRVPDLGSSMLVLVLRSRILLSPGLLYNELHCINTLSHSGVHLYLDCVQVEVNVLSKTYGLGKKWLNSLFDSILEYLNSHASI